MANNLIKCALCGKECPIEVAYKIRHKGKIYCFCSKECKDRFQQERFGEVLYP